jgi:hypothetical protein
MTTLPPGPPADPDPVRLLVQAVGQLPADQRDLVLTWLLHQRPDSMRPAVTGESVAPAPARLRAADLQSLGLLTQGPPPRGAAPGGQQVVPVRFPADQHAELRDWCAAHGFSMATVIRGLVTRFLEGQQRSA